MLPVPQNLNQNASAHRGWRFLLKCGLLAAIFSLNLSDQSVFGSCGEYLYVKGKPVSSPGSSGMSLDDHSTTSHRFDVIPAQRKTPCQGPGCSKSPAPAAPSVPIEIRVSSDSAILSDQPEQQRRGRTAFGLPDSDHAQEPQYDAPFRPPKSASSWGTAF